MRSAFLILAAGLLSCGGESSPATPRAPAQPGEVPSLPSPEAFAETHSSFASYFHQGLAELSRYELRQARYGDVHEGEAVLIFVTEPFLPQEQVKHEHGERPDAIQVLKLNHYRRFYTGIYPYNLMTSTFSPELGGPALKVSSSVSEWCGHAYVQLNRREAGLELRSHSYFQDEADQEDTLADAPLEDAVLNTLRRDPSALRTGSFEMVPGLHYLRLRHHAVRPYRVEARRDEVEHERFEGSVGRYTLRYPELDRTWVIYYGTAFPHAILGWDESGEEGRTEATRTHAALTDYWNHHGVADGGYREALGLRW